MCKQFHMHDKMLHICEKSSYARKKVTYLAELFYMCVRNSHGKLFHMCEKNSHAFYEVHIHSKFFLSNRPQVSMGYRLINHVGH